MRIRLSALTGLMLICLTLGGFTDAFGQGGTWTTKEPIPDARRLAPAAGAINGLLYVAAGFCTAESIELRVYDPITDSWTTKAPIPGLRTEPGWGVIGDKLYIVGGNDCSTGNVNTLFEYDATTDAWTTKQPLPYSPTAVAKGVIDGRLYIAGGEVGCSGVDSVTAYDPVTDTWSPKTSMPSGRQGAASGVINGKLYVTAGQQGCGGALLDSLVVYDPMTDTWTTKAPIPTKRNVPGGGVVNGIFYVVGGVGPSGQILDTVEAYDPATDTWKSVAPIPTPRSTPGVGVLDGILYVLGGEGTAGSLTTNEAFTPPISFTAFLHALSGTLLLDENPPTATTPASRDSLSLKFAGGNPWKEIGTWSAVPTFASGSLESVSSMHAWLGLKNSDDIGTRFDLRGEVLKNGTLVTSGEIYCITGVTRNPSLAKEVTVSFGSFSPTELNGSTDVLSLRVLTRIGSNGAGGFCGGHSNAVGLRLYFDAVGRASQIDGEFVE
jgi:N-acetylneuraminic acid mutarotase